jgi:hypothetical protein
MATNPDKHLTVLDFESLESQLSSTSPETRPDVHLSQGSVQEKENKKRKASLT